MTGEILLHVETSADLCSVALGEGNRCLGELRDDTPRSHGRVLTEMIRRLIHDQHLTFKDLRAVAVSGGPGSYTGLRIGVSVVKGLAWGLNIPLIAIPTTEAMVHGVLNDDRVLPEEIRNNPELLLCPLIDARRMEVYTVMYDVGGNKIKEVEAKIVEGDTFNKELSAHPVLFFGSGAGKCGEVISHQNAFFAPDFIPLAQHLIQGARERYLRSVFEDIAYYEPFYLKDFIPTIPRNKLNQ